MCNIEIKILFIVVRLVLKICMRLDINKQIVFPSDDFMSNSILPKHEKKHYVVYLSNKHF